MKVWKWISPSRVQRFVAPARFLYPWNSPGQNTGVCCPSLLLGIFPTQGSNPLQADSLTWEPPGKPKNTGVGSLSLLQGIFPTQESYQDLLHCRQILYQLSYQGSLWWKEKSINPGARQSQIWRSVPRSENWQEKYHFSLPNEWLYGVKNCSSYLFLSILGAQ